MKLKLMAAFGAGYVLGARAGRERYEEIKDTAARLQDDPRVQEAASKATTLVRETATKVQEDPRVKNVAATAEEKVRSAAAATQDKVKGTASAAKEKASATSGKGEDQPSGDRPVSVPDASDPPLAEGPPVTPAPPTPDDSHLEVEDEVVFSSGPEVVESVDELNAAVDDERS